MSAFAARARISRPGRAPRDVVETAPTYSCHPPIDPQQGDAPMQAKEPAKGLEARVEALEKRTTDLTLKSQIVGSLGFGKTGLDIFFGEPEFWENPYDSGQADCAKRCISELVERRK